MISCFVGKHNMKLAALLEYENNPGVLRLQPTYRISFQRTSIASKSIWICEQTIEYQQTPVSCEAQESAMDRSQVLCLLIPTL